MPSSPCSREVSMNSSNQRFESERSSPINRPLRVVNRWWWLKALLQPLLLLLAGVALIAGLGMAQRLGWISAGGGHSHKAKAGEEVRYICPMMCTPPQTEPGRCPVCAMELVPATSGGGDTDPNAVTLDPVARRLANIQTAPVKEMPFTQTIRTIGEIRYDEGTLKTIAAYVDGRLDTLYANYTGVHVKQGDHLALLYSPELYSGQVELLAAKQARGTSPVGGIDLYRSARQKLLDLGMTSGQIAAVEKTGKANSRIYLCAPISGTVIEKHVVEGQYVKEGQAVFKLADLSTIWLMLKLFPEDAAKICYGQKVTAILQSHPGREFIGRIAFIDPMLDVKTRTVGVRVVIPNKEGFLRAGDYANATIHVPHCHNPGGKIYDKDLANKWISPRHPHVVEKSAGKCRVCGVELVPASHYGFTGEAVAQEMALVVPRQAVLMAGKHSVLYVETKPGRFEIRPVVLGPRTTENVVIVQGVKKGEEVATAGNFLIDSQMQLAGKPSLIDPTRVKPSSNKQDSESKAIRDALAKLSPKDRQVAKQQRFCPVADMPLGSMGCPLKVDVKGTVVFICCEGCRSSLLDEPGKYLAKLTSPTKAKPKPENTPQLDLPPIITPQLIEPELSGKSLPTPNPEGGMQ